MDRVVVGGFDQGINLTGWAVGAPDRLPTAGAWRFQPEGDDLGLLGVAYRRNLETLHRLHGLTHAVYESPVISRFTSTDDYLRKRLGLDMVLEVFCADHGIVLVEEPFDALKKKLVSAHYTRPTGKKRHAQKLDMVAAARALGVALPLTKVAGIEDAADAVAAWLIGVETFAPEFAAAWNDALYRQAAS